MVQAILTDTTKRIEKGLEAYITRLAGSITFLPEVGDGNFFKMSIMLPYNYVAFSIDEIEVLQNELLYLSYKRSRVLKAHERISPEVDRDTQHLSLAIRLWSVVFNMTQKAQDVLESIGVSPFHKAKGFVCTKCSVTLDAKKILRHLVDRHELISKTEGIKQ